LGPEIAFFLDRLMRVRQWFEVARAYDEREDDHDKVRTDIAEIVGDSKQLEDLQRAAEGAAIAAMATAHLSGHDVSSARRAAGDAALALAVRDRITPEQFWALYTPFAAFIPMPTDPELASRV
jgi:hypothetical protein